MKMKENHYPVYQEKMIKKAVNQIWNMEGLAASDDLRRLDCTINLSKRLQSEVIKRIKQKERSQ